MVEIDCFYVVQTFTLKGLLIFQAQKNCLKRAIDNSGLYKGISGFPTWGNAREADMKRHISSVNSE
ncbi:MAG: hypothetical protein V7L21_11110 [Nostoc sp.]|uniref:hypothetical protein n=1 Tax=Nostoc sp. TaxID=1180 RepID=UPI002FF63E17